MVLHVCTLPNYVIYLYQVLQNYHQGFYSYLAETIFLIKLSKGHNSIKNEGGVMILKLCTLSDDALYL